MNAKEVTALIDKLNFLYPLSRNHGSGNAEDILAILDKFYASKYVFIAKSTWEFFKIDVSNPRSQLHLLYKELLNARAKTSFFLLDNKFEEARKWQNKRVLLHELLDQKILSRYKNPPYFKVVKSDTIEFRVPDKSLDTHLPKELWNKNHVEKK